MFFLLFLSLCIFLVHLWTLVDIVQGLFRMTRLSSIPAELPLPVPLVSVVVPACNEEHTIAPALQTLLDQDYPNLEIIVVNDRSTDGTGAVLTRLRQTTNRSFTVLNISKLPAGWLGKSHALQRGAETATGDILLFTDADVEMENSVVSRAVTVLESEHLDHLSLIFQVIGGGWLLNGMVLDAASGLLSLFKPWKASEEGSRFFMGVGAFNMVRREVYEKVGGLRSIRMHPIDDIMLGKIIKEQGFRQKCLLGLPLVRVAWYATATQMVDGLMKNVFSVLHYRVWLALLSIAAILVLTVFPLIGLMLTTGFTWWLLGGAVSLRLCGLVIGTILYGMQPLSIAGGLIAPVMSVYIVGRAVYSTVKNKGIYWRGTHYPLSELRKSKRILF